MYAMLKYLFVTVCFYCTNSDFSYFSMDSLTAVRYVGGFAKAGSIQPEEFYQARPDPCAPYATAVMSHMNNDHADSLVAMVKHAVGIECSEAKMISLDRLGLTVSAPTASKL